MSEINSPAARFSRQGKGNYQDVAFVDDEEDEGEDFHAIEGAARQGDYDEARLLAAQVVGDADEETVEAARDELDELDIVVDYKAHPNTIASHVGSMESASVEGIQTTVVRIAIQIVECINNGVEV